MALEITSKIDEPQKRVSTTGLYPGMFHDNLKFTFEATNFHTTDSKEVEKVFADLDLAVLRVKELWGKGLK